MAGSPQKVTVTVAEDPVGRVWELGVKVSDAADPHAAFTKGTAPNTESAPTAMSTNNPTVATEIAFRKIGSEPLLRVIYVV